MNTVLDEEPITTSDIEDMEPCYWLNCQTKPTWEATWKCGCVCAYCDAHMVAIRLALSVECNPHDMKTINPAKWRRR